MDAFPEIAAAVSGLVDARVPRGFFVALTRREIAARANRECEVPHTRRNDTRGKKIIVRPGRNRKGNLAPPLVSGGINFDVGTTGSVTTVFIVCAAARANPVD